jgi:hypothetical protein
MPSSPTCRQGPARPFPSSLTGKSIDEATSAFKSDEKTFSSVSGAESEALVGYIHTGTAPTSRLIWFQDTGVTGLPVTPDGRDIKVTPAGGCKPS